MRFDNSSNGHPNSDGVPGSPDWIDDEPRPARFRFSFATLLAAFFIVAVILAIPFLGELLVLAVAGACGMLALLMLVQLPLFYLIARRRSRDEDR